MATTASPAWWPSSSAWPWPVALQVGDRTLATCCASTAAATGGFLLWNYPRGLLFAGGGAYVWGTVIAMACLYLVQRNAGISPWFPVLLLIYPIWETCFSASHGARRSPRRCRRALHFHQLIYRRIVRRTFDEDIARRMLKRNNAFALPLGLHPADRRARRHLSRQHGRADGAVPVVRGLLRAGLPGHHPFLKCPVGQP